MYIGLVSFSIFEPSDEEASRKKGLAYLTWAVYIVERIEFAMRMALLSKIYFFESRAACRTFRIPRRGSNSPVETQNKKTKIYLPNRYVFRRHLIAEQFLLQLIFVSHFAKVRVAGSEADIRGFQDRRCHKLIFTLLQTCLKILKNYFSTSVSFHLVANYNLLKSHSR